MSETRRDIDRRTLLGTAGLMIAASLAPVSALSATEISRADLAKVTLRVPDMGGLTEALFEASGQLRDAPYRVEFATFSGAPEKVSAFRAGAIDIVDITDLAFVSAVEAGIDLKLVHATRTGGRSFALVTPTASRITAISQLKGLKVAVAKGSSGHVLAAVALERAGLSAKDVELVYLKPGDAAAALSGGHVDAWFGQYPFVMQAEQSGTVRVLANADDLNAEPLLVYGIAPAVLKNPVRLAAIRDLLERWVKAEGWQMSNPADYAKTLVTVAKLSAPVAQLVAERREPKTIMVDAELLGKLVSVASTQHRAGLIQRVVDYAPYLDATFNSLLTSAAAGQPK